MEQKFVVGTFSIIIVTRMLPFKPISSHQFSRHTYKKSRADVRIQKKNITEDLEQLNKKKLDNNFSLVRFHTHCM